VEGVGNIIKMEFCPNCGKLLRPKEEKKEVFLACNSCGYRTEGEAAEEGYVATEEAPKEKIEGVAVNEGAPNLPTTTAQCEKCHTDKAYYWLEQTRAADEAPTRFLQCVKCGHKWREYS